MKGNKMLGMLAAMAIMSDGLGMPSTIEQKRKDKDIDTSPKNPPIPKGCKEYFFRENGTYHHTGIDNKIRRDEVVFHCIAATKNSAIKKFKKYQNDTENKNSL